MSSRYMAMATPPRSWVSETDVWQDRPTMTVVETDSSPVKTGLLNADGVPIYRLSAREPIGFRGGVR